MTKVLHNKTEITIRFSEVDSLGIVWHGNYVKFLEDGRENFGMQYGISYWDIYKQGLVTPVVKLDIEYKKSLKYGDKAYIATRFIDSEAAKIIFDYTIFTLPGEEKIATAQTIQVFLDLNGNLQLNNPDFFIEWKKKWNIG